MASEALRSDNSAVGRRAQIDYMENIVQAPTLILICFVPRSGVHYFNCRYTLVRCRNQEPETHVSVAQTMVMTHCWITRPGSLDHMKSHKAT